MKHLMTLDIFDLDTIKGIFLNKLYFMNIYYFILYKIINNSN